MLTQHMNLTILPLATSTVGLTQPLWLTTANTLVTMTSTIILTVIAMISAFFLVRNEVRKWKDRKKNP